MRIFSCQLGPLAEEVIRGCACTAFVIWVARSGKLSSSAPGVVVLVRGLGLGLGFEAVAGLGLHGSGEMGRG